MTLLNHNLLQQYVENANIEFDKPAIKAIRGLEDSEVLFILYSAMLQMTKFESGALTLDHLADSLNSAADKAPEIKVLAAYFNYVREGLDKADGLDKLEFLFAAEVFVHWMKQHVTFSAA